MDQVMVRLFGRVIRVLEDCCDTGFTITAKFDCSFAYIVKGGNDLSHYQYCHDTGKFASVWIDFIRMSRDNVSAGDARVLTAFLLEDKACSSKIVLVRTIANSYRRSSDDSFGNALPFSGHEKERMAQRSLSCTRSLTFVAMLASYVKGWLP
jgi:hypothetical protein